MYRYLHITSKRDTQTKHNNREICTPIRILEFSVNCFEFRGAFKCIASPLRLDPFTLRHKHLNGLAYVRSFSWWYAQHIHMPYSVVHSPNPSIINDDALTPPKRSSYTNSTKNWRSFINKSTTKVMGGFVLKY